MWTVEKPTEDCSGKRRARRGSTTSQHRTLWGSRGVLWHLNTDISRFVFISLMRKRTTLGEKKHSCGEWRKTSNAQSCCVVDGTREEQWWRFPVKPDRGKLWCAASAVLSQFPRELNTFAFYLRTAFLACVDLASLRSVAFWKHPDHQH